MKRQIDNLDKKILSMISKNARLPFLEVSRACNVSGAAIHQRVQKLSIMGVIKGSEFIVDPYKIGYHTCAFIGIAVNDMKKYNHVATTLRNLSEVVECHSSTGKYALFIKVYAKDNRALRDVIVDKLVTIDGVSGTETLLVSLEELFVRQIASFDFNSADFNNDSEQEA
ncbi:MAG: Lrp/AsnC ligand binding domain-containing protein [Prevotellaceae bacterium]|jgi:Lrp/AsnC family transcriptional regulator for asnA, asnC and gidA|nr:Lrp/AsnC ligand binding domain-containing protein [Prevotellaceae bacterium]